MDERRGDEATPLMVQVDCGSEEVVRELLAQNANVDLQDQVSLSPLSPISLLHLPSPPGRALCSHEGLCLRSGEHGSDVDCPQSNSGPQEQGKWRGRKGNRCRGALALFQSLPHINCHNCSTPVHWVHTVHVFYKREDDECTFWPTCF